ncbi:MAG: NAD(P)-binding protein [Nitrospirota bacterium]
MDNEKRLSSRQDRLLGMDMSITRRDFLNALLLGAGAALLDLPAPLQLLAQGHQWDGYGGTGDYADAHGNTEAVVSAGHGVRDGRYENLSGKVFDTGEVFDLVAIGGGLSGLGAAFYFKKTAGSKRRCLVLENHPVFGGVAKRNEFVVNGQKLIGPQGSNSFVVIDEPGTAGYEIYNELEIPHEFEYQKIPSRLDSLRFDRTNFGFMLWHDTTVSVGYFFDGQSAGTSPQWITDMWNKKLEHAPLPQKVKKDLLTWRTGRKRTDAGIPFEQWLDSMSYKEYLEKVMGLDPAVTAYVDPVLAASIGLGCDVISAYGAYQIGMPGFHEGSQQNASRSRKEWHSFPGGNDGFVRHLVKKLVPDAIHGKNTFADILNQRINFGALDDARNTVRIRLGATAARVEHIPSPEKSEYVLVTYVKEGKLYRLKARSVVMASGGWMSRRVVRDLPEAHAAAYRQFYRSPVLVVNVAVTNWRFLARLGITACRWFEGFGFSCNLRQSMVVGDYRPPLDPDKPAILTFYVPFYYPGLPLRDQGVRGRTALLSTSYADYERSIREQMLRLFGGAGFDPRKDIAGIILNRWGHAYVNPQPGFYFGRDGHPAPHEVIRKGFGRIAFANSELNGHQHWVGAVSEGQRAARQVAEYFG